MRLRPALVFALLLLTASVLVPVATADHAYSHRITYYGRVVDVDGVPVQGITVTVDQTPARDGACGLDPKSSPVTNANGEYFICNHNHAVSAGTWTVTAAGVAKQGKIDPDIRKHRVDIQLDKKVSNISGAIAGDANFSHTYSLIVVLWQPGDASVESVQVEGVAKEGREVEAVLTYNDGKTLKETGKTNSYGEVRFDFDAGETISSGSVKVMEKREGLEKTAAVDTTFYSSTVVIEYEPEIPSGVWGMAVIIGAIAVGAIGYAAVRFKKQKEAQGVTRAARRRKK